MRGVLEYTGRINGHLPPEKAMMNTLVCASVAITTTLWSVPTKAQESHLPVPTPSSAALERDAIATVERYASPYILTCGDFTFLHGKASAALDSRTSGTVVKQLTGARFVSQRREVTPADSASGVKWHGDVFLLSKAFP